MADPPRELITFCADEWPRLVGALTLVTGNRDVADELAQDTLVQVCRHWRKISRYDAPGAWAHRVAMNLANSHYRRRAAERRAVTRLHQRGGATPASATNATPVDTADALAVRSAVRSLPTRQRMVIVLRYYLDLPVAETAQAMQCPEGTVKTLTRQAILALRQTGIVDDDSAVYIEMEKPSDVH